MKKTISLGIALTSMFLLSACGSKKDTQKGESENNNTINILSPFIETEPPTKDSVVLKKLEKETGKKINITWTPNTSYEDKMNITLASDNVPQIMVVQQKSGGFIKSAENGAFWDLSKYLKDYPNLKQANPDVLNNSSVNGKVYGIYRKRDAMRTAVIIRKDWLKKLGLDLPKNTEDLYNLAKAFTENDPDGNGKNDTYGIIIPKWPGSINTNSPYDVFATWFGAGNTWVEKDGKLEPSFMNDEYLESMKYVKDMISKGYINKDFATLAADKWNDPFINGQGGIIVDTFSRADTISNLYEKAHPGEDIVVFTGNLENAKGEFNPLPTGGYSGILAIPKASVKTEKELKDILKFLDKLNGKDIQILINNGIEGKNFKLEDGMTVAMEGNEAEKISNDVKSFSQIGMNVTKEIQFYYPKPATPEKQEKFDLRQKIMASDLKKAVFNPAASYITDTFVTKGTQLDQIISDARIKYVAGQMDDKGWKDTIQLWKDQGGTQLIKETNDLHKKLSK
ncbi:extracellular solute-binding protein [Enterococcus columbae]|uniref:Extracellular solute-binding protein n=1 Tax=Enterococcus columbae DSM 7374 = ATCC 51263 TaxID=1121865 RepID=S0KHP9_9ENTE|nr:extracellular solute-binding protein [Enterococcus columbae]EOT44339.1 hypothetical protein OMW_00395 [Enterococcus columbae DSM 7374 = ATCC 51263]EOW84497.1 hypothetical protein I568_00993 [Enterococcus columbae DSM 7374 = ATCC 51263]OJG21009.1 hypothetical protein RR47_GL001478 [Enterococcus columbae DSM 7374 = ATCC 51263]